MKKALVILWGFLFTGTVHAQQAIELWNVQKSVSAKGYGKFKEINIDMAAINKLHKENPAFFEMAIRDKNNNSLVVSLAEVEMKEVKVKVNNAQYVTGIKTPRMYRGKVQGMTKKHDVMLTLAPDFISLAAHLPEETITVEEDSRQDGAYVLLNSAEREYKTLPFNCGVTDEAPASKREQLREALPNQTLTSGDKCTFVFIDCTNRLYNFNGRSVQSTINYVYSIWNGVRTAFLNEQLNVFISEINVWTIPDSFDVSSTLTVANRSFANFYLNNYWGNMAMLLDWSLMNGAIAGGYGWAKAVEPNTCSNYIAEPNPDWNFGSFIYNNLNTAVFGSPTYSNFPVAAIAHQVYISVHELGHLFGSWHTHSCSWPGGAIDNCVALEGTCTAVVVLPPNGGTFMSYCDRASPGVNFNNGFGPLPGATIRQFVVDNTCIDNCNSCTSNDVIGSLTTSVFLPKEVMIQIVANGTLTTNNGFIKLDAGSRVVLQNGFKVLAGSKVHVIVDGCGGIR